MTLYEITEFNSYSSFDDGFGGGSGGGFGGGGGGGW